MIRAAKGRVVTITSGLAFMTVPTRTPYVMTKYAMEGFLDSLRYEMEPFGVKVSMIEPGNFLSGTKRMLSTWEAPLMKLKLGHLLID